MNRGIRSRGARHAGAPAAGVDVARRRLSLALLAAPVVLAGCSRTSGATTMRVWTGPSCSCCREWIAYLEANVFDVKTFDGGNAEARARLGVPVRYGSCHTGEIAGYAVEGHVPVSEILRLIEARPDALGIAVPGMPLGSPGMDGPEYGGRVDPYDVLLIRRDGSAEVFRAYR